MTSTRREFVAGAAASAGALLAPGLASARARDDLITKPIPGTHRRVPAIGLGTFMTFDEPRPQLSQVVERFWAAGGRVIDTAPVYGASEANLGAVVQRLGIADGLFLADKVAGAGAYLFDTSLAEASLARSYERLGRTRPFDLVQNHSLTTVDVVVPLLHALKREGRLAALGVTHHEPAYFDLLAGWIERGDLDWVQIHYSIASRTAERRVLPLAADRGVAVLVNMALEKGRLHALVGSRRVPDFARAIGIRTWSEYFLKWVISHPAVTCALAATADPEHLSENVAALRGPLPDARLRERMLRHLERIPGFDQVTSRPWYPGRSYRGQVTAAQAALRARSPWWPSAPSA
jgi:aryl-alcohol dehydrogenase-like predicted oxidoreductase